MCPVEVPDYASEHNAKRALHMNTHALTFDADLAADAQAYADGCPTGHGTAASRDYQGENLYWAGASWDGTGVAAGPVVSYENAINSWYGEIADYLWPAASGATKTNGGVIGHFTQVVWRSTTKVGCGANSKCSNMFGDGWANNVVVCRYDPAGNLEGSFFDMVGNLISSVAK
jgi:hypothetical protein